MRKIVHGVIEGSALLALPLIASAQGENIDALLQNITDWIDQLIPILIGLALLFFLWGLAKYMLAAGDEEKQSEGRRIMVNGIITLFVMVAVWGLVNFLVETFGFETTQPPTTPELPEG